MTEKDLAFFQYRVEQSGEIPGSSDWDLMLDKHINKQLKYQAWRRTLPVSDEPIMVPKTYYHSREWIGCRHLLRLHDFHYSPHPVPDAASVADLCSSGLTTQDGKTEYKSVTISFDATPEEIMDIYFDDDFRPQWVSSVGWARHAPATSLGRPRASCAAGARRACMHAERIRSDLPPLPPPGWW